MCSVPALKTVRGYSFFGDFLCLCDFLMKDTGPCIGREAGVLEYFKSVRRPYRANARAQLGPDCNGVGWVVFVWLWWIKPGQNDLSQLRSLQDWFLKYELQTVPGVV